MDNKFIFWDEMWNEPRPKPEDKESVAKCCGDWDEKGNCQCKTKQDENKNKE
jgi:hypothetical protein